MSPREHAHDPLAHGHDPHGDDHAAHAHGHDDHAHHAHGHAPDLEAPPRSTLGAREPTGVFNAREAAQAKRLLWVLALFAVFFGVEMAGAVVARSVVLQADALHLLMDWVSLAMSLVAMRLAVRKPTPRFTFGMRRAEPVAAMFNAGLVLLATVQIVREALGELAGTETPEPGIMLVVATGALVVNGFSAFLLHGAIHALGHDQGAHEHGHAHAHGHALNLRGVWLHLVGDVLGSVAALLAALVLRLGGPRTVDPIATFVVAAILVFGALRLLRDASLVLLEAAPPHLPVTSIRARILAFDGVSALHDLHVWSLGAGHDAITAHVRGRDPPLSTALSRDLRAAFGVEYVTVQVELDASTDCALDEGD